MDLRSLTYTSLASLDLDTAGLEAIQSKAREINALDGVTGLLIFNGTHFLQIVEGAESAIDALLERLQRDPRHSSIEVRDRSVIDRRSFPDWSMELVRVDANYFAAKDHLTAFIPATVPQEVRDLLFQMTEGISGTIRL